MWVIAENANIDVVVQATPGQEIRVLNHITQLIQPLKQITHHSTSIQTVECRKDNLHIIRANRIFQN